MISQDVIEVLEQVDTSPDPAALEQFDLQLPDLSLDQQMPKQQDEDSRFYDWDQFKAAVIEQAAESIANYLLTEGKELTSAEIQAAFASFTQQTGLAFGGDNSQLVENAVKRHYQQLEIKSVSKLSKSQKEVLVKLLDPEANILANGVGPALSTTLKRLEERNLVMRVRESHKRKTSDIKLTPLGFTVATKLQND